MQSVLLKMWCNLRCAVLKTIETESLVLSSVMLLLRLESSWIGELDLENFPISDIALSVAKLNYRDHRLALLFNHLIGFTNISSQLWEKFIKVETNSELIQHAVAICQFECWFFSLSLNGKIILHDKFSLLNGATEQSTGLFTGSVRGYRNNKSFIAFYYIM